MNSSDRFLELLEEIKQIHLAKRHDYAEEADPLSNLRMCEAGGIEAWEGVVVRLTDKMSRLLSFMKKRELKVKDESIIDTFKDMSNYSLLAIILFEQAQDKKNS